MAKIVPVILFFFFVTAFLSAPEMAHTKTIEERRTEQEARKTKKKRPSKTRPSRDYNRVMNAEERNERYMSKSEKAMKEVQKTSE